MAYTHLLVMVRETQLERYREHLAAHKDVNAHFATSIAETVTMLPKRERDPQIDVLVLDNGIDGVYELVGTLRPKHPRLLILLVDEDADFAMPGAADDISTDPFTNDDLMRRIHKLLSDRRLETLRADLMPPVRDFAKRLRKAVGESEKQEAAVSACRDLGYDYVAFYQIESLDPPLIILKTQDSAVPLKEPAPLRAAPDDLVSWVAKTGQSRAATANDDLTYALVRAKRFSSVACTAVGTTSRYGVMVACCDVPITRQQVMLLELVSAQLAAMVAKE